MTTTRSAGESLPRTASDDEEDEERDDGGDVGVEDEDGGVAPLPPPPPEDEEQEKETKPDNDDDGDDDSVREQDDESGNVDRREDEAETTAGAKEAEKGEEEEAARKPPLPSSHEDDGSGGGRSGEAGGSAEAGGEPKRKEDIDGKGEGDDDASSSEAPAGRRAVEGGSAEDVAGRDNDDVDDDGGGDETTVPVVAEDDGGVVDDDSERVTADDDDGRADEKVKGKSTRGGGTSGDEGVDDEAETEGTNAEVEGGGDDFAGDGDGDAPARTPGIVSDADNAKDDDDDDEGEEGEDDGSQAEGRKGSRSVGGGGGVDDEAEGVPGAGADAKGQNDGRRQRFSREEMAKWDAVPYVKRFARPSSKSPLTGLYAARRSRLRKRERSFVKIEAARMELDQATEILDAAENERKRRRRALVDATDKARAAELKEPNCGFNVMLRRLEAFGRTFGNFDVDSARVCMKKIGQRGDRKAQRLNELRYFVTSLRGRDDDEEGDEGGRREAVRLPPSRMRTLFPHRVEATERIGLDWTATEAMGGAKRTPPPRWDGRRGPRCGGAHWTNYSDSLLLVAPPWAEDWNARADQLREYKERSCGGGRTGLLDKAVRYSAASVIVLKGSKVDDGDAEDEDDGGAKGDDGGNNGDDDMEERRPPPPEGLVRWLKFNAERFCADDATANDALGPARTRILAELLRNDVELSDEHRLGQTTDDDRVRALRRFMERTGHCVHPRPEMQEWIGRMRALSAAKRSARQMRLRRRRKRRGEDEDEETEAAGKAEEEPLDDDDSPRITEEDGILRKMDALGFCWDEPCECHKPKDDDDESARWMEKFDRLLEWKRLWRGAKVDAVANNDRPGGLSNFLRDARLNYKSYKNGTAQNRKWPKLTEARIGALLRVLHVQELAPEPVAAPFEERLRRFRAHRRRYGHCVEPNRRCQAWVDHVRKQRYFLIGEKSSLLRLPHLEPFALDEEKMRKLDEAGLCWGNACWCYGAPRGGRFGVRLDDISRRKTFSFREYVEAMRESKASTGRCDGGYSGDVCYTYFDFMRWRSEFVILYRDWKDNDRGGEGEEERAAKAMRPPLSKKSIDALNEAGMCWRDPCRCLPEAELEPPAADADADADVTVVAVTRPTMGSAAEAAPWPQAAVPPAQQAGLSAAAAWTAAALPPTQPPVDFAVAASQAQQAGLPVLLPSQTANAEAAALLARQAVLRLENDAWDRKVGETFEVKLSMLAEHRRVNGHCVVPNDKAQRWIDTVRKQRRRLVDGSEARGQDDFNEDMMKWLDEVGLCWGNECRCYDAPAGARWLLEYQRKSTKAEKRKTRSFKEYLDDLRDAQNLYGACFFPYDRDARKWLSEFVVLYREWKRTGIMKSPLSRKAVDALNDAGACWSNPCVCHQLSEAREEQSKALRRAANVAAAASGAHWAAMGGQVPQVPPLATALGPVLVPPAAAAAPVLTMPVPPPANIATAAYPPYAMFGALYPETWNARIADLKTKFSSSANRDDFLTTIERGPPPPKKKRELHALWTFLHDVKRIHRTYPTMLGENRLGQIREVMGPDWPREEGAIDLTGTTGRVATRLAPAAPGGKEPERKKRKVFSRKEMTKGEMENAAMEIVANARGKWSAHTVKLPS